MDNGYSVWQTNDGGYIIGGRTDSFSNETDFDMWLIKTDGNGNEQWNKTFGGVEREKCRCVRQTTDHGYILAGSRYIIEEDAHAWVVKTDKNGREEWNRTYGNWSSGNCIQQTNDGGYIIVGNVCGQKYEDSDILLVKTDEYGNEEWNKTFGRNKYEGGATVQQTDDGGYIIGGDTNCLECYPNALLIKTDEYGNEEWNKTFGGTLSSVQQTKDSGYVIGGSIRKWNRWLCYTHPDIWMIKTDSMGNVEWERSFGTGRHEAGEYAQQTSDGGFIVVGETYHVRSFVGYNGDDEFDIWLIKIDDNGNEEWIKKLGEKENYEYTSEVHQTFDGAYIIVGGIYPWGTRDCDVWLIKTAEPTIKIELTGSGLGVSALIKNTGKEDLHDINWSIYVEGIVFTGGYTHGVIPLLPAGGQTTVSSGIVLGVGPITIKITAEEVALILNFLLLAYLMLPM
ncbi:MAG: hypothetical protein U9O96_01085 [Candidatus Thermoplasmatota archaeon]|nr:hypothetical protein [Candidatus Thermoplasmatota archaeon]